MRCRFALIRRLGALALLLGVVALPVNQLFPYLLLLGTRPVEATLR